jgi:hypothetical protein
MKDYYPAFLEFAVNMEKLAAIQQGNLFDHEK